MIFMISNKIKNSLPAIDNAIYVKHWHNLKNEGLPKITGCVKVAHQEI